jgi:diamine N-acetyltransferase
MNFFSQAVGAYQRGDFPAARAKLEEIAAVKPSNAEVHHLLAVVLAREQLFVQAATHFLTAIQNAPERHDFKCNYALLLHERGDHEQAITLFRQELKLQTDFAPALNGLGSSLYKLGEMTEAEQFFRRALQVLPGNPQHHNNLGNVLKERGSIDQAITCYRSALALHPDYMDAHFNLGVSFKEQDRYAEARECFEQILQRKPDYRQAADQLEQVANFWREPLMGRQFILRPYTEQDAPFLNQCFRDSDFMANYNRSLAKVVPVTQLAAALRKAAQSLPWRARAVDWVIYRKGEVEHPIGLANLADLDLTHRRAELLVGFACEQDRYSGSVVESVLLVMDFAFNKAHLNKLTSVVYADNPRAQSITLKGGFVQEGFRSQHLHISGRGYVGMYENGLTVAEFRGNQRLSRLSWRFLGRDVTHLPTE